PTLRATGWFRTERVGGKWWLVTPSGHLFWSVGLDCVGPDAGGPTKGRESLFTWLPEKDDPLSTFGSKGSGWVNFWGMNLYRKYGAKWETPWLDLTRDRMRAWGFNTVANWSWDRSYKELRLPYTPAIHYGGVPTFPGGWNDIPDFYSEAWPKAVEGAIKTVTDRWRDDPYCIGYFVDNELSLGGWGANDALKLPENALKLPGDRAVKQAFTKLLRDKYLDIVKLNEAWGSQFASWDDFQAQPISPVTGKPAVRADLSLLLTDFSKRYFTVVSALMHQYAPNQLYLGPRFAVAPDECVLESAEYCDVVSYNIYGRAPGLLTRGEQIKKFDKPVVIGEFHFGALDRGMFSGGLGPVDSQEERGVQYEEYVKAALDQPWCVGAHWFTYGDEALTGRSDGENYNIGFVNVTDTPYVELVRHATKVNFDVYQRRGR
ncbi:MAG: beta-galactosidase, partial [Armatimonadota bacterium]